MKTTKFIALALFAMTFAACGNKANQQQTEEERFTEVVDSVTGISRLTAYKDSGTVVVNEKSYNYKFEFSSVDSLPVITNSQGVQYYDNEVLLTVKRDSSVIYRHTFRKRDFIDIVPADFLKSSSLVGFNYNVMKSNDSSAIYFIATVGDPDETAELSFPIEIKYTPGGSISMQKAKDLETEPLHNGMNQDPNDDCGV